MTREPKIGDKIQYFHKFDWIDAGVIVAVHGNIAYSYDPNSKLSHKQYFGCSPVPAGCETANEGFIWKFGDTLNKLHRIVE